MPIMKPTSDYIYNNADCGLLDTGHYYEICAVGNFLVCVMLSVVLLCFT